MEWELSEVRGLREKSLASGQRRSEVYWAKLAATHADSSEEDWLRMSEACVRSGFYRRALWWLQSTLLTPDHSQAGITDAGWLGSTTLHSTRTLRSLLLGCHALSQMADDPATVLFLGSDDTAVWKALSPALSTHSALISELCFLRGCALESSHSERARLWLQRALDLDPSNVAALHRLVDRRLMSAVRVRVRDSDSAAVTAAWQTCLSSEDSKQDSPWLARSLAERGQFAQAVAVAEQCVSQDPCNAAGNGATEWLAALYALKRDDALQSAAQRISEMDSASAVRWLATALCRLRSAQSELARRCLSKATKLPDCPPLAWLAYAESLSQEGAAESALRALRTAGRVFDGSHEWPLRMARQYCAIGDTAAAKALLSCCVRDLKADYDARVWAELGVCELSERRYTDAHLCLTRALSLSSGGSEDWATLINLGHCVRLTGDYEKALQWYDRADEASTTDNSLTLNCRALCHAWLAQFAPTASEVRRRLQMATVLLHRSLATDRSKKRNDFAHSAQAVVFAHL